MNRMNLYRLDHAIAMAMSYGDLTELERCDISTPEAQRFADLAMETFARNEITPPWQQQVKEVLAGMPASPMSAQAEELRALIDFDFQAAKRPPSERARARRALERSVQGGNHTFTPSVNRPVHAAIEAVQPSLFSGAVA